MELMYQSTRSEGTKVTASRAILKGLADDGGLFVPVNIPKLDVSLEDISKMTYQETAYEVMKLFFTDFTENELKTCIERAYDSKFDTKEIAPLVKKSDAYYLELFHGATIAFKDMALSILPHLLTTSAKKNNIKNEIVILTATSGDTGKAALAGFADVEGTSIIVFYPKNGVSKIQERQMVTQKGANTKVVGITGNFDDAQSGVKAMFNNKELAKVMDEHGYQFSSANSINIGRLVPQVVYYVYSYTRIIANGDIKAGEKETSETSLQHSMPRIWVFLLENLSVLQMKTKFFTISLRRVFTTETVSLSLLHHHLWIFLSQATSKDLSLELQGMMLRKQQK